MNCEIFMSMLDRYADLSEMELAQLEEHAQNCDNCRAELEFMRSIIGTAQSLPPIEPPTDFLDTLNARLDKELAAEPKIVYFMRQAKPYMQRYGTVAACLAIGIVIGANGNMLVSQMNDDNDGVISSTTVVTDNGTTPVAENAVAPQNETVEAVVTPAPRAREEQTVIAMSGDKADTATKPTVNVNTNTTEPVKEIKAAATAKPVEPTATMVAPVATAVPEVKAAEMAAPEVSEGDNAGIMVASLDVEQSQMPVGYSVRRIAEPEETPEVYAEAAADVVAEYSIATMQPESETAYVAPLSSTIMVKAEDAERVKEIIMEFVEATYGNYYMMTGDKLYNLALRLESEGIWYYANLTDTGAKVSFKLVIK